MIKNRTIPDFHSLYSTYRWKPLYGCPGRYILREEKGYTITELAGSNVPVHTFSVDKARDTVYVVVFQNGGLISYRRPDGSYVNTLNTTEGLKRKLTMLDIQLPEGIQKEE